MSVKRRTPKAETPYRVASSCRVQSWASHPLPEPCPLTSPPQSQGEGLLTQAFSWRFVLGEGGNGLPCGQFPITAGAIKKHKESLRMIEMAATATGQIDAKRQLSYAQRI